MPFNSHVQDGQQLDVLSTFYVPGRTRHLVTRALHLDGTKSIDHPAELPITRRWSYILLVAYDGTDYNGWQVQLGNRKKRTIQGVLEAALCTCLCTDRTELKVQGAGRTDAGVHALGQVVQFYTNQQLSQLDTLHLRLNSLLPYDVRVMSTQATPMDFSVRLSALWKEYHYKLGYGTVSNPLERRHRAFIRGPLDVPAMADAIAAFEGTHDFSAFANRYEDGLSTVRTLIKARIVEEPGGLRIELRGSGFLYKMVRHIVGATISVGRGRLTKQDIQRLLESGLSSSCKHGEYRGWKVAEACGLCKIHVEYPSWDDINAPLHPNLPHDKVGRLAFTL